MDGNPFTGGSGARLTKATVIVAGVACLASSILSIFSIWLQLKNYRKPLLQRYVVRILCLVPIYATASWASLWSLKASSWIEPIRDVYEAFTIYTFLQLLINFLGGERALIVMMHGRPPTHHLWPLNHCLGTVDISDPHTFLAIKRGILQYTWVKPMLAIATIAMKATDTYQEGYVGLRSGYLWSGIIYNVSITISLYSLAMFWVCMSQDLQSFRPMPKFLCIKLIIFASYWQGFFLSILVWLGAIPDDVKGYSPDNIAAAIQNALICFEMPAFAVGHWYAFSWHDYADPTISSARLPVLYALRDSFGCRDLIEDTKETFGGKKYEYRLFDSTDDVLTHESSQSRMARMMEGMRYERGGKGKYWIPKPGEASSRTPLLAAEQGSAARSISPAVVSWADTVTAGKPGHDMEPIEEDSEDERLYANARTLEFGDWHYPVIAAHEASRESWMRDRPTLITPSTHRHVLHPTEANKSNRRQKVQKMLDNHKVRDDAAPKEGRSRSRLPIVGGLLTSRSSSSSSSSSSPSSSDSIKSNRDQLVDLIIEDTEAEDTERVRARKEGSARWNEEEPRLFVRAYPGPNQGEEMREGFAPDEASTSAGPPEHASRDTAETEDGSEDTHEDERRRRDHGGSTSAAQGAHGDNDDNDNGDADEERGPGHGRFDDEQQAWRSHGDAGR